jgi:cell shape-determining protein MreC
MPPIRPPSRRLLVTAFFILVTVAAFLPVDGAAGRVYQRVVSPLHSTVSTLITPVSSGFAWVGSALRFERETVDHGDDLADLHERIDTLQNQTLRLRAELRKLRKQNRMLQGLQAEGFRFKPMFATVTGASEGAGVRTLKIDPPGRKRVVEQGQAVISETGHLVGQVARADRLTAVVERIDSPGVRLDAVLTPASFTGGKLSDKRLDAVIQLEAVGPMRFEAIANEDVPAAKGEIAHLRDETWPGHAWGRIIGRVVDVRDAPQQQMRKRIVVECMIDLSALRNVIVLVEEERREP